MIRRNRRLVTLRWDEGPSFEVPIYRRAPTARRAFDHLADPVFTSGDDPLFTLSLSFGPLV